jgi:hypothetical protein
LIVMRRTSLAFCRSQFSTLKLASSSKSGGGARDDANCLSFDFKLTKV